MHVQSSSIASPPRERIEDALRASFPAGHVTTRVDRWRSLLTTLGDSTAKKKRTGGSRNTYPVHHHAGERHLRGRGERRSGREEGEEESNDLHVD